MKNAQEEIAAMIAAGKARPFEVRRLTLSTQWTAGSGEVSPTEATLKTTVGDQKTHTAGDGVGPIHAFDIALKKAVDALFPRVEEIVLYGYRIEAERTGSDAVVCCTIKFRSGQYCWTSIVEHANQDFAAFLAVVDGYTYFIMKEADK